MKILIKKDIKLVGIFINFAMIPLGLILVLFLKLVDDDFLRIFLYIFILFLMVNLALLRIWAHDFNYKSDMFLNSLPLDKRILVASRYATIIIYILYSSLIAFIMSYSFRGRFDNEPIYPIHINEILNLVSVIIFFMACYLPRYYRNSHKTGGSSNIALVVFMAAIILIRLSYKNKNIIYQMISNIELRQFSLILMILSIIAYILSLYFSIRIYSDREF